MSSGFAGMQTAVTVSDCPAPACSHCGGTGTEPPPARLWLKITLPIKTVSEANRRDRWGAIKRKKEQRKVVGLALGKPLARSSALAAQLDQGGLDVVLTRITPSARGLDDDNAASAFKAIRDEVAVWLGIDDRDPRVRWTVRQEKGRPKTWQVRIEIRERRGA